MQIKERIAAWRNRGELISQEIVSETDQLTQLIQPYADEMGYLGDGVSLTIIRGDDPIGETGFRSILLRRKERGKLLCWFLQSDGSGFKTGDLQVTMAHQPALTGTNPVSFETIEVFKLPRNECLEIAKTFRSGTE